MLFVLFVVAWVVSGLLILIGVGHNIGVDNHACVVAVVDIDEVYDDYVGLKL